MIPDFIAKPNPDIYKSNNYAVLDYETTNKDKGDPTNLDNHIVMCVVYTSVDDRTTVLWGDETELGSSLTTLLQPVDFVVAHNAKFELGWTARCGIDTTRILVYDTQIARYVQDGNRFSRRRLNDVAALYALGAKLSIVEALIHGGVCPSKIPRSLLQTYCIQDVHLTRDVFLRQREEIFRDNLAGCLYTRCIFTPVLADIESKGLYLDAERVRNKHSSVVEEWEEAQRNLNLFAVGINWNSPKQMGEFLYDTLGFNEVLDWRGKPVLTPGGKRATDAKILLKLEPKNKKQQEFIETYRKFKKLDTAKTTLDKFMACVDEAGGVLLAQFNQTVTKSHRLSSSGKRYKQQLQNLDRTLKPLFTARKKGWLVGETDGAQLEFRVGAYLGQDQQAITDIVDGLDIHSFTGSVIEQVDMQWLLDNKDTDPEAKRIRQNAKPDTFKPLYGGQTGTEDQMRYYAAFKARYSGITKTQDAWVNYVLQHKYLQLETGMRFYWPDTRATKSGYVTNSTNICNYPVQNLATAEIIPIAVTYMWHRLKAAEARTFLVNTIHDSAIAEVHPDEKELFGDISVQSFTSDVYEYLLSVYNIDFNVPLGAEPEFSMNWGEH